MQDVRIVAGPLVVHADAGGVAVAIERLHHKLRHGGRGVGQWPQAKMLAVLDNQGRRVRDGRVENRRADIAGDAAALRVLDIGLLMADAGGVQDGIGEVDAVVVFGVKRIADRPAQPGFVLAHGGVHQPDRGGIAGIAERPQVIHQARVSGVGLVIGDRGVVQA